MPSLSTGNQTVNYTPTLHPTSRYCTSAYFFAAISPLARNPTRRGVIPFCTHHCKSLVRAKYRLTATLITHRLQPRHRVLDLLSKHGRSIICLNLLPTRHFADFWMEREERNAPLCSDASFGLRERVLLVFPERTSLGRDAQCGGHRSAARHTAAITARQRWKYAFCPGRGCHGSVPGPECTGSADNISLP